MRVHHVPSLTHDLPSNLEAWVAIICTFAAKAAMDVVSALLCSCGLVLIGF